MDKQSGERIRLTNHTARKLRQNARRDRKAIYTLICVLSAAMLFAAVYAGVQNLLLVPVLVLLTVVADMLLLLFARRHYLDLTSQAICTEAAARMIAAEREEMARREENRREIASIKADLDMGTAERRPSEDAPPEEQPPEEPQDEPTQGEPSARRRRKQANFQIIHGEHAN